MSVLKIFKHGNEFGELVLEQGKNYTLGRGTDCNVVLDSNRAISRHHVRIEFENGKWMAHLVSKVGQMLKNDEPVIVAELNQGTRLFIDPYEISYIGVDFDNELLVPNEFAENEFLAPAEDVFDTEERTAVVASSLTAHVTIEDPSGQTRSVALTQALTQFGRDEDCHVPLQEGKVSRKHFEIRHLSGTSYQITDLGSANGTKLNNLPLEAHEPYQLSSKDVISVGNSIITFELRDPKFESLMNHLVPLQQPEAQPNNLPANGYAMIPYDYSAYANSQGPAVVKVGANGFKEKFMALPRKTKMRIGLGASLAIIVAFGLMDSGTKPNPQESSQSSVNGEAKVSPEQQAIVKDTFVLARNHFMQGKYELCSSEITKLHALVPFHENSKELEVLCSQAKELQDLEREKERLQKQKENIEQQVAEVVAECRTKLATFKTEEDINTCLGQAIELDPQNAAIEEMRNYLKMKDDEKVARAEQEDAHRRKVQAGEARFYAARSLKAKNQLKKAISAYNEYIDSSYPDPKNLKAVAKRELASVKAELGQKISGKLQNCQTQLQQNKYKQAVLACEEVLKEDSTHEQAHETKRQAAASLRKDMRGIYEDAILEESLGNIDAAKDKWKKIVEEDLRDGEHATKARIKLRKYGVEL
jgi:pSer/pThr/pTyr-binding forkhead associated (FHA) protein/tetratricopeptide (TPR) repeat protein